MLPFFSHKRRVRSCPVYHSTPRPPRPELWRSSWGLGGAGWPPTSLPGAALRSEGLPQNGTSLRLILWAHRIHYDRGLECLGPAPVPWAALLGMEVRRRLCGLSEALGGQMQGIGGHFVWSSLEGLAPCLGTRHRPPCDAPTGLSKVTNDEHWAVSGMW